MKADFDEMQAELDDLKKMWWLHDSYWHATMVRELGEERANELNLEANERFFRKYTLMLLRSKKIKRPTNVEELYDIFRLIWKNVFWDEMYIHEPVTFEGNEATWTGCNCHAFDSLSSAKMTKDYACGCQSIRNGVMKALKLKQAHCIEKSLINGDGRCVVKFSFEPK